MTLDELRAHPAETVRATDIAPIIGMDAGAIRFMAREHPELLGFPVIVYRNENSTTWHVKIPRRAFLRFLEVGNAPTIAEHDKYLFEGSNA